MAALRLKEYRTLPDHTNHVLACLMREIGVANEQELISFFCNDDGSTKSECILIEHARRVAHIDCNSKRSVANLVAAAFIVGFQNIADDSLVGLVRKFLKPTCDYGVQVTSGRFRPNITKLGCINPLHYLFDATTARLCGFTFPADFVWAGLRLLPISSIEVQMPPKPISRGSSSSTSEEDESQVPVSEFMTKSTHPTSPISAMAVDATSTIRVSLDEFAIDEPDREMMAMIAPVAISKKKQTPRKPASTSPRKQAKGVRARRVQAPIADLHLGEGYQQFPAGRPIKTESRVIPSQPYFPPGFGDPDSPTDSEINELMRSVTPSLFAQESVPILNPEHAGTPSLPGDDDLIWDIFD